MTQRYPLAWPHGKARTPNHHRQRGKFAFSGRPITMSRALERVQYELDRAGARNALISSNVSLRLDGLPRSGEREPDDPGVCLYFDLASKPHALACDGYSTVPQNLAALAAHLEATRAILRYGVATSAEMFTAFVALPAPRRWWEILGVDQHAPKEEIERKFRSLAAKNHPDKGGTHAAMSELTRARTEGLRACG